MQGAGCGGQGAGCRVGVGVWGSGVGVRGWGAARARTQVWDLVKREDPRSGEKKEGQIQGADPGTGKEWCLQKAIQAIASTQGTSSVVQDLSYEGRTRSHMFKL